MGSVCLGKDGQKTYPWVKEMTEKSKTFCRCCKKDIDIACMGESAL